MMTNSDVTIFNLRIGSDRREKLCATRIMGVSWYGTKGEAVSDTDRKDKAKCVIRIPATATVEAGKQYISEEKYKKLSDEEAEVLDYPEGSLYRARTVCGGRTVAV